MTEWDKFLRVLTGSGIKTTYHQKSSTVSKLATSCIFSSQTLLLFSKNHSVHLFSNGCLTTNSATGGAVSIGCSFSTFGNSSD